MIINTIEQLKELALDNNGDPLHVHIVLAGGLAKSSKRIWYSIADGWMVCNEIDETFREYKTDRGLERFTNIPKAVSKGCLHLSET